MRIKGKVEHFPDSLSLSLAIRPYYLLLPVGLPNYILCQHIAEVNWFLLVLDGIHRRKSLFDALSSGNWFKVLTLNLAMLMKKKRKRPKFTMTPIQILCPNPVALRVVELGIRSAEGPSIRNISFRAHAQIKIASNCWLFRYYGISTFVGYLMPNPFLYK